jgi:hypothetical protein
MLAHLVAMFSLLVPGRPPRGFVRVMIRFMVRGPEGWKLPVVGANEMMGCVLFGREEMDRRFAAFDFARAPAELPPDLAFAAASI